MINRLVSTILILCTVVMSSYASPVSRDVPSSAQYERAITEAIQKTHLKPQVAKLAITAYQKARQRGFVKKGIITIIDYSLPSSQKRMWVVDLVHQKVLYHTLVAHGKNTGNLNANSFSNQAGSLKSSLGVFQTGSTYVGHKGYSLRLQGLEHNINSNAYNRAIVVHGASYVNEQFAQSHGRLGRSWGCPAIAPALAKPVINTIKDGSLVFAYYPDKNWLSKSRFL